MRTIRTALLILSLTGAPLMVGCDRTVAHDETTKTQSDGTVKHDETTVKQDQNGNTIKEESKSTDKP